MPVVVTRKISPTKRTRYVVRLTTFFAIVANEIPVYFVRFIATAL